MLAFRYANKLTKVAKINKFKNGKKNFFGIDPVRKSLFQMASEVQGQPLRLAKTLAMTCATSLTTIVTRQSTVPYYNLHPQART